MELMNKINSLESKISALEAEDIEEDEPTPDIPSYEELDYDKWQRAKLKAAQILSRAFRGLTPQEIAKNLLNPQVDIATEVDTAVAAE